MELSLESLYEQALKLQPATFAVPLGKERIRGALKFKEATLGETVAFLRDFASLAKSNDFSEKELAKMLENTCVETASFLFSAGAPAEGWRQWCSLGSMCSYLAHDPAYSMQLAAISRMPMESDWGDSLRRAKLESYRNQAIQFVIFRPQGIHPPVTTPVDELDKHYEALLNALQPGDERELAESVHLIVRFWLNETSYGRFEPGIFPVFEPEINATVAALLAQGVRLKLDNTKVKTFLQAALE